MVWFRSVFQSMQMLMEILKSSLIDQKEWKTKENASLTVHSNVIMNEPWRRRAYLSLARKQTSWILIWRHPICYRCYGQQLESHLTWHSYVASSIFWACAIFSRQLFGYWKSTEYLGSPEYVCFPTVINSRPFSPLFRRTHETWDVINVAREKIEMA